MVWNTEDCYGNPTTWYSKKFIAEIEKIIQEMATTCFYDDPVNCSDCDMKANCSYLLQKKALQMIEDSRR